MTRHAHLKERIRARMSKTGERYATARRHVLAQRPEPPTAPASDPATRAHHPGNVPATTALRVLLSHAGVVAPHTGAPFSEAMLFGIAGGIGIGVFSFRYEREDLATFYVGGRHHWYDDQRYLVDALGRLTIAPVVQESGSARAAEAQLRTMLAESGPCIAWVDSTLLPHRTAPTDMSGSGYHVIAVYRLDDEEGTALIGDLADEPVAIALPALAAARGRIKKDRYRLLALGAVGAAPALPELVTAGLRACHHGLLQPALPAAAVANARLGALETWAERMEGSRAKTAWEQVYRPGRNFFRGLCAIHDFIEHYGTGGGLCRPLFADFLAEAADALRQPGLAALAERYGELGRAWSALADAALPDDVGLLREAKALLTRKAALISSGGPVDELRATWADLAGLEQQAADAFPLSDDECRALRTTLREHIRAVHHGEIAAHHALASALDGQ